MRPSALLLHPLDLLDIVDVTLDDDGATDLETVHARIGKGARLAETRDALAALANREPPLLLAYEGFVYEISDAGWAAIERRAASDREAGE